jgi:AcrR family transcriptional regulator
MTSMSPGEDRRTGQSQVGSDRPRYLVARANRREASRRRVELVALRVFAKRGFDSVTVDEICEEAEISPATFYRYFGSKDGVIFRYEKDFLSMARDIGASIDPAAPASSQIHVVLQQCAAYFAAQSEIRVLRDRIVLADDALLQHTFAAERRFENALAGSLAAARLEDIPSAGTVVDAAICLVALRLALTRWRYEDDLALPDLVTAAYESVRSRLAGH